jgi:hypothetical protein
MMLSKIDLSDGFWRMLVKEEARWNFAYVMPDPAGSPIRLVVPSALQMGWAESPAYFCAATETGRDIIQSTIDSGIDLPPNEYEKYMRPAAPAHRSLQPPNVAIPKYGVFVYVDDYISAAVENKDVTLLEKISHAALHGIHSIFPPPAVTGQPGTRTPSP